MPHPVGLGIVLLALSFSVVPMSSARAAGGGEPDSGPNPAQLNTPRMEQPRKAPAPRVVVPRKKKKLRKTEEEFRKEYREAYALVQESKYAEALQAFLDINEDDHPDVANYIGFLHRKLGDYEQSKLWYEHALAGDPNHLRTWQYYGMWQVERGQLAKAQEHLEKVKLLCGNTACKEYIDLKAAIDGDAAAGSY